MPANFPGSNPALATNKADATTTATDHKDHHNQLGLEVNAIGALAMSRAPANRIEVYVDSTAGSDANNGKSWGTPFLTLGAAITATPNGGKIWVAPSNTEYVQTSTLNIDGHSIEVLSRIPNATESLAVIRKNFNGDLFSFGANSGHLKNLMIYANDTAQTGAAIKAVSSASNGGDILVENCVVSGGVGFERNVVLDGSAWAVFGIRKVVFKDCQFFGVRTAGESMVITRGVHIVFQGGFQDEARVTDGGFGTVAQGIRILDVGTTDVKFLGFRLIGSFYTEAAGDLMYVGQIVTTVTCAASSDLNTFIGRVGGTFTNNGNANNVYVGTQGGLLGGELQIRRGSSQNALTLYRNNNQVVNVSSDGVFNLSDGVGGSFDTSYNRSGAGVFAINDAVQFQTGRTAASLANNTLFRHSADERLTFKDNSGATFTIEARGLKLPVRVAAPINVTVASPGATIDGVTMAAADRVLLANQTTASQNGIYSFVAAASPMTRATDSDSAAKMTDSLLVTVDEGTVNKDSLFSLSTNKPITLGTTALRFTRVHPSYQVSSHPSGTAFLPATSKLENLDRTQIALANQALLATGTVRVFPMGVLRAGDTLAAVNLRVATTASAAITNSWGGIARLGDRVVLAVSATSTATTAAEGLKTFTFGSAFTADKDETLVGFVMYQATTPPSLHGINHGNVSVVADAPVSNGTSNTGATTPVTVGATLTAFTADTEQPYAYCT